MFDPSVMVGLLALKNYRSQMKNQDKHVVKIGKKYLVEKAKLKKEFGPDGDVVAHIDYSTPKLKGYFTKSTPKPVFVSCGKYHSNRSMVINGRLHCSRCGKEKK